MVIPALDAAATLASQLEALAAQEGAIAFEIVVVDNGSTDGTRNCVTRVAAGRSDVRLIDGSARRGVNYARSVGARAAGTDLLLYCDADDVVSPTWVHEMTAALEAYDLVGGYIDEHRLNGFVDARYRTPKMLSLPGEDLGFLPYAVGACFGIHRRVLEAAGGWDEDFPAGIGGDDVDLSWRCQLAGFRLGFAERAVIHYRFRQDHRAAIMQAFRYGLGAPYVYARFRKRGAPRRPFVVAAKNWWWVVVNAPKAAVYRPFRRRWLRWTALAIGRAWGSARYRVMWL